MLSLRTLRFPATVLVFLTASAGTRVIAAYFLLCRSRRRLRRSYDFVQLSEYVCPDVFVGKGRRFDQFPEFNRIYLARLQHTPDTFT